ncbi:MAG: YdcF family protein [Clostridia bacterium]|nr:YdcF family protein [Clostridia bacterium]
MKKNTETKLDAILLLGLKLKEDGSADEEMLCRVRRAAEVFHSGVSDVIIACGGETAKGYPTEAEVMKDQLIKLGVPSERVMLEDKSLITVENIRNARAFLRGEKPRAALVTSDYHGFRAKMICRMNKIRAVRFDAVTPDGDKKKDLIKLERLYLIDLLLGYQGTEKKRSKAVQMIRRRVADPVYERLKRKQGQK